ncbi:hypothetical protein ES332_D01G233200v1 [Gossypium tomentosum]|uniref:Uncharacterized protein n=1 Tax=Gossypium tomentosum TaxID=34277 RepID=A0A5D2MCT6_GOSTO|nr:hypothetical protein ES332_D01G233200v1 [Gossypium tomentosum]
MACLKRCCFFHHIKTKINLKLISHQSFTKKKKKPKENLKPKDFSLRRSTFQIPFAPITTREAGIRRSRYAGVRPYGDVVRCNA